MPSTTISAITPSRALNSQRCRKGSRPRFLPPSSRWTTSVCEPPASCRPRAELPVTELAVSELAGTELPCAELPRAELARAVLPRAGLPRAGLPRAELVRAELTGTELAGGGLPRTGLPRTGLPRTGLPGPDCPGPDCPGPDCPGPDCPPPGPAAAGSGLHHSSGPIGPVLGPPAGTAPATGTGPVPRAHHPLVAAGVSRSSHGASARPWTPTPITSVSPPGSPVPCLTMRAARANSAASAGRRAGSLLVAASTSWSTAVGMPGMSEEGAGTSWLTCWYATESGVSPRNGWRPVSSSKSITPAEYTSPRGPVTSPATCSGGTYATVPMSSPALV